MTETRIRLYSKGNLGWVASYGKVTEYMVANGQLRFVSDGKAVITTLDYLIEDFEVPDEPK